VSTGELKKMASVDTVNFDKNYFPDKRFNLTYKEFFEVYEKIHSGPIKGSEMHQFIFDNSDYSFGRIHKELFAKSAFCDVRELIYMLMGRRLDFETASSNNEYKLFHNDTIFYIAYKTYEGGEPFSSRHDIDYFYEVDITENSDEVRFENCPVEVILNDDYPYLLNQYQYTIASFENEPVFQGIPSITTSVREANLSKSIVWSDIELDKRYKMIVLYRQGYGSYYDAFIPGYEPEVVYNEWVYGFMEYGGWCIRSIAPQGITDQTKMKLNEIIHVSPPFYEDLDHDGVKEVFKVILCNGVIIDVQIYKKNNKQFEEIQTPNEQWLAWLGENPAYKNFLKITQVDKYRTGIPADKAHRHFLMGRKK
jgi:hypothetical protein